MDILLYILIFLHILGAAVIVGGWFATLKKPTVHPAPAGRRDCAAYHRHRHHGDPAVRQPMSRPNYYKIGVKLRSPSLSLSPP